MPVYDYKCQTHGVFFELATLENYDQPCACPQCGSASARVILLAPEFLDMAQEKRQAFATNEKAQNEPIFSTDLSRQIKKEDGGCGCSNHKKKGSRLMYTAQGDKFFPSARPWMISH